MLILNKTAIAVSLREMVDSSVEVSLGGARVYSATGGRSSVGMAILPPGGAYPSDVVDRGELYFVVIAGKITLEVSRGGGSGDDGGGAGRDGPAKATAVFGVSQGSIAYLRHGHTFSIRNATRTTAQVVYMVV